FFESSGTYQRKWLGNTSTNQVDIRVEDGYIRARNNTRDWSLYFSDFGISTYNDAIGEENASGSLIFRDTTYSTARSLMAHSTYGVVALQSEYNDIILAPMNTNRSGNNLFKFAVKDNDSPSETDGWIAFGSPNTNYATGIRFQKTTSGTPTIWITNGNGDIGTGNAHANAFIGELQPRANYNYLRAERSRFVMPGTSSTNYAEIQFSKGYLNSLSYHGSGDMYIGVSTNELRITNN